MATVILVRHGRTTANTAGVLAGRSRGVMLDDVGREQVERTAARLAVLPLAAVVSSPLERCRDTARAIAGRQESKIAVTRERGIVEVDYGSWTGQELASLTKEPLWSTVQHHPAGVGFPEGESMAEMSARAVATVRRWDATVGAEHGEHAVWVAVSHGDVIKAVLADALGMHLDVFQRIVVDPAAVSVVRYSPGRPFVLTMNSHEGDLSHLRPPPPKATRRRSGGRGGTGSTGSDAAVGGGAGPSGPAAPGRRG